MNGGEIAVYSNTPGIRAYRVYRGVILNDEGGSRIEGVFSTFVFYQIFWGIFLGLLTLFAAIAAVFREIEMFAYVVAMGLFWVGITAVGDFLSRGEKAKILSGLGGIQAQPEQATERD